MQGMSCFLSWYQQLIRVQELNHQAWMPACRNGLRATQARVAAVTSEAVTPPGLDF